MKPLRARITSFRRLQNHAIFPRLYAILNILKRNMYNASQNDTKY